MKSLRLLCVLTCVLLALPLLAQDAVNGTWAGDWGPSATHRNDVTLQLKWDGKALTGTVNPGPNAVTLQKSTFDPKTGTVHMEADSKNMMGTCMVHFVIDGKISANTMTGSWNHAARSRQGRACPACVTNEFPTPACPAHFALRQVLRARSSQEAAAAPVFRWGSKTNS